MNPPTSTRHHAALRRAFTLVELLITITIILVLAALSLAGFSKMRNYAYQITSTSNLSQLQIANVSYAGDHNGKYVPFSENASDNIINPNMPFSWFNNWEFLKSYRGDPLEDVTQKGICPRAMLDPLTVRAKKSGYDTLDASYGYNAINLPDGDTPSEGSFNMSQVRTPSQTACFMTATCGKAINADLWWSGTAARVEGKTNDGKVAFRHKSKAIVVYYDGHINVMSQADINQVKYGQSDPKETAFWNASYSPTAPSSSAN